MTRLLLFFFFGFFLFNSSHRFIFLWFGAILKLKQIKYFRYLQDFQNFTNTKFQISQFQISYISSLL